MAEKQMLDRTYLNDGNVSEAVLGEWQVSGREKYL